MAFKDTGNISGVKLVLSLFLPQLLCFSIHIEETAARRHWELRKEETVAINNNISLSVFQPRIQVQVMG